MAPSSPMHPTLDPPHPARVDDPTDALLARSFARFDPVALGVACGAVLGALLLVATAVLVLRGGPEVGPTLALLGEYFPGYTVTWGGAVLGLLYGLVTGFALGWLFASAHNVATRTYLFLVHLKANVTTVTDVIDPDHSL